MVISGVAGPAVAGTGTARARSQRAKRIAIIFHDFSPGGTEKVAIRLAGAWSSMDCDVAIYCGSEEGPLRALVPDGIRVVEMSPPIRRGFMSRVRLGRALARMLDPLKPDIVFAPGNFHFTVLAVLMRSLRHCKPAGVAKISNCLARRGTWSGYFTELLRWKATSIDAFVAMSPSLAAQARETLKGSRIASIAEPTLDASNLAATSPPVTPTRGLIIAVGRLVRQKDFGLAINAFAALGDRDAQLCILGDGVERSRIEAIRARCGVAERIRLAGFVPDISPFLARARLLLLTSRYEGYPAVVVEALAAGVPVVTTDCSPALRELIIDADLGEIVPDRSPRLIAAAIRRQLSRPMPSRKKLLASVGHNTLKLSAKSYLAFFDEVCARAPLGESCPSHPRSQLPSQRTR